MRRGIRNKCNHTPTPSRFKEWAKWIVRTRRTHRQIKCPDGIQLPVKVRYPEKYSKRLWEMWPRPPVTEDGRIVYALPGGGEYVSEVAL